MVEEKDSTQLVDFLSLVVSMTVVVPIPTGLADNC